MGARCNVAIYTPRVMHTPQRVFASNASANPSRGSFPQLVGLSLALCLIISCGIHQPKRRSHHIHSSLCPSRRLVYVCIACTSVTDESSMLYFFFFSMIFFNIAPDVHYHTYMYSSIYSNVRTFPYFVNYILDMVCRV